MKAKEFLKEKGLSGNALSSDGVIRLMEEYAELCMDIQAKIIVVQPDVIKSVCDCTSPISGTSIYKCGRCGLDIKIR